ncbi:MAG TPA: amidophosphoribosyltransferase [Thermodesulfobacteriota bacterium]|nr:amidophosphoribosyltransferase [Deltaproteobacteria bacterium]HNU71910.1 amidophosphoribosyltransferase [Thermodesulfobacteriota bacterium]
MFSKLKEHCGVFGVYGHPEAAHLTYLGLYALQHRGQESAGIVSTDGISLYAFRRMGLVADVFCEDSLKKLKGHKAIGHVRYSTSGVSEKENAQPLTFRYSQGAIAVSHNGTLVNADELRDGLEKQGRIFQSTSDTEVIIHLMAMSQRHSLQERITDALEPIKGAYSLLFLSENEMVAARDPYGFRPLVLGSLDGMPVISSETCALDLIGATYVREVEPGELILINQDGMHSLRMPSESKRSCVFELIYFSRPDSQVFGREVYRVRKEMGKQLAREYPVEADLVIPVPDSGVPAAIGYAEESGIPFEAGIIRNHYVGRTFIEPEQSIRHFGVKVKLSALKSYLQGKRVVVIDDSIVRATSCMKIATMIRAAGAKEIHFRIASPPITHPCFYGIDTPSREELIAARYTVEDIRRFVTSESLGYLSLKGLSASIQDASCSFCYACFTGRYPIDYQAPKAYHQPSLFRED